MSKIKSTELFKEQVLLPSAPFSAMGPVTGEFEIKNGATIIIR